MLMPVLPPVTIKKSLLTTLNVVLPSKYDSPETDNLLEASGAVPIPTLQLNVHALVVRKPPGIVTLPKKVEVPFKKVEPSTVRFFFE